MTNHHWDRDKDLRIFIVSVYNYPLKHDILYTPGIYSYLGHSSKNIFTRPIPEIDRSLQEEKMIWLLWEKN